MRFRQKYEKGPFVAYYRDFVRFKILQTPPVLNTTDMSCEIHALTSEGDWINLVWSLKTFFHFSQKKYSICIHDDGSLSKDSTAMLKAQFPNARFVSRREADEMMREKLKPFPQATLFRENNLLAPKILDFSAFLRSKKMLVMDSDVLFFASPKALLDRIEDPNDTKNCFNADCKDVYTISADRAKQLFAIELTPRINSGLGLIHSGSLNVSDIENFLASTDVRDGFFWRVEQTLFALCSSKYGVELLPEEYTLRLTKGLGGVPFRHYVGAIRHLMYSEGICELSKRGFLSPRTDKVFAQAR